MTVSQTQFENRINLIQSKIAGVGTRVDETTPTFPWMDLTGFLRPNTANPTTSPSRTVFRSGATKDQYGWAYAVGDEIDSVHHVDHDWLPGHDSFIHVHWKHNGTDISGGFSFGACMTYTDRDGTANAVIEPSIVASGLTIGTHPQYDHFVTEIPLTLSPVVGEVYDSDIIEVDGLFEATWKMDTVPTITGGEFFISMIDIHYQSTGVGTKNSGAPFYT